MSIIGKKYIIEFDCMLSGRGVISDLYRIKGTNKWVPRVNILDFEEYKSKHKSTPKPKAEILTAKEKEYLRDVIRPFRYDVKYIRKAGNGLMEKEYIFIKLKNDSIDLPFFPYGTMYKGLTLGRDYTLEELGL